MKISGCGKKLLVSGIVLAVVLSGTACSKKLHPGPEVTESSVQQTIDPLSFEAVDAKLRDYTFGLNEYMKDHQDEKMSKNLTGRTPNGVGAECTYTVTPDGKYEALQMQKKLSNGVQVDEYFNMGDSMFIARTTVYDDGNFDPVDKYYIIDGVIYKVDGSAKTVTRVVALDEEAAAAKKTELDLYYTFEEIRAIYA